MRMHCSSQHQCLPRCLLLVFVVMMVGCSGQTPAPAPTHALTSTQQNALPIPNERFLPLTYQGQIAHWVRQLFQDKNGDLWIGTNHYGAARYNGDTLQFFYPDKGFDGTRLTAIVEDAQGKVWFGRDGFGLCRFNPANSSFTHFTTANGLCQNTNGSIAFGHNVGCCARGHQAAVASAAA